MNGSKDYKPSRYNTNFHHKMQHILGVQNYIFAQGFFPTD